MNFEQKYANVSTDLPHLAVQMAALREKHTKLKAEAAEVWHEHEYLAKRLIPQEMERCGFTSINIKGIGRLELRHDALVSVPKEHKHQLYAWLENNGYEDLIVGTVNSSTMKAQVKKWIRDGEEFPINLINYSPFDNAVLVKAK